MGAKVILATGGKGMKSVLGVWLSAKTGIGASDEPLEVPPTFQRRYLPELKSPLIREKYQRKMERIIF